MPPKDKKPQYKMLEVVWVDSEHHADWSDIQEVLDESKGSLECQSLGYLILDAEDRLVLATSITSDEDTEKQISAYITIPKLCVVSTRELRKK